MYIVYSKPGCSWCVKAKELLLNHNLLFEEQNYNTPEKVASFKAKGYRTFPQVFNDKGELIGGFDALQEYLEPDNF